MRNGNEQRRFFLVSLVSQAGWRRITGDKQKENLSDEDFEPLIPTGGRPHVRVHHTHRAGHRCAENARGTAVRAGLSLLGRSAPGLPPRARPSRCFTVSGSSPPWACSWMCQQRNRAMRSLVKAGGGEERNVTRHRVRSASRPSDRTRSISVSIASRSNDG